MREREQEQHADETAQARGDEMLRMSYRASLTVVRNVAPYLRQGDGMAGMLRRSAVAVPRLMAAALFGRVADIRRTHALAEAALHCRQVIVMLSYCRDLHARFINGALCAELIDLYRGVETGLSRKIQAGDSLPEVAP